MTPTVPTVARTAPAAWTCVLHPLLPHLDYMLPSGRKATRPHLPSRPSPCTAAVWLQRFTPLPYPMPQRPSGVRPVHGRVLLPHAGYGRFHRCYPHVTCRHTGHYRLPHLCVHTPPVGMPSFTFSLPVFALVWRLHTHTPTLVRRFRCTGDFLRPFTTRFTTRYTHTHLPLPVDGAHYCCCCTYLENWRTQHTITYRVRALATFVALRWDDIYVAHTPLHHAWWFPVPVVPLCCATLRLDV